MLPTTGTISIKDIATELNLVPNTLLSLNDTRVRTLAGKLSGTIGMADLYGKANTIQLTVATSPSMAALFTSQGDNCAGAVIAITTNDDSEITLEDLYLSTLSFPTPNLAAFAPCVKTDGNFTQEYLYNGVTTSVVTPPHARYPTKTFATSSVGNVTVYPKAAVPANAVHTITTSYTKTGQYSFLGCLFIDNISKVNANITTATDNSNSVTYLLANIKSAVKALTDKQNVAIIACNYIGVSSDYIYRGWALDLALIRSVASNATGSGYAYGIAEIKSGNIFQ